MELFTTILKWLYAIDGAVLFLLYVPQIVAVYRDHDGAKTISLMTWGLWVLSSLITITYAHVVARDFMFTVMSFANLAGCGGVYGMTLVRRAQYKARLLQV